MTLFRWLVDVWPFSLLFVKPYKPEPIRIEYEDPGKLIAGETYYNEDCYATFETAQAIARRFNALGIRQKPPREGAPSAWHIFFSEDEAEINVGTIAKFFSMYPESRYGSTAMSFALGYIAMVRRRGGKGV